MVIASLHPNCRGRAAARLAASWLVIGVLAVGCGPIPRQYLKNAQRGVTLSAIVDQPDVYMGKTVILGGVIVEQRDGGDHVWWRMRNRPLDSDYVPHRSGSVDPREDGHYWVAVVRATLPPSYQRWARVTVVGLVLPDGPDTSGEPALGARYLHGWSYGGEHMDAWEASEDPNYHPKPFVGPYQRY